MKNGLKKSSLVSILMVISQKDIIINNKEKQIQILKTSQRSDDEQKIIKSKVDSTNIRPFQKKGKKVEWG